MEPVLPVDDKQEEKHGQMTERSTAMSEYILNSIGKHSVFMAQK